MDIYSILKLRKAALDVSTNKDASIIEQVKKFRSFYELALKLVEETEYSRMFKKMLIHEIEKQMLDAWLAQAVSEVKE